MSQIWNSFKIAFSMYSKIPMPHSDWSKENMRYALGFFPMVGLVVGALALGLSYLMSYLGLPDDHLFRTALLTVIPILVTGGIHMDGFLDTSDALSSWQEKERRLEILKDSHAGAFAIICCAVYMVLYLGAVSMLPWKSYCVVGLSFVQIRAFSGLSVVTFPMAKNTGLAVTFSDSAHKQVIRIWLLVLLALCTAGMVAIKPILGGVCTAAVLGVFGYYRYMSGKNFGGINGDLAGWFLQVAELAALLTAAVVTLVLGGNLWN